MSGSGARQQRQLVQAAAIQAVATSLSIAIQVDALAVMRANGYGGVFPIDHGKVTTRIAHELDRLQLALEPSPISMPSGGTFTPRQSDWDAAIGNAVAALLPNDGYMFFSALCAYTGQELSAETNHVVPRWTLDEFLSRFSATVGKFVEKAQESGKAVMFDLDELSGPDDGMSLN